MPQDLDLGPGFPQIHICESQLELEQLSGLKLCHGYYNAQKNEIYATADSLAHEVAHVKDISSGLYLSCAETLSNIDRATAVMRNESVAILFAFSKVGIGGASLPHEARLIDWIQFEMKRKSFERAIDFATTDFKDLQNFATWLVEAKHSWRKHLEFLFRGYLSNEQETLWYNRRSEPYRKSSTNNHDLT